jgi:hypothetical protein
MQVFDMVGYDDVADEVAAGNAGGDERVSSGLERRTCFRGCTATAAAVQAIASAAIGRLVETLRDGRSLRLCVADVSDLLG